MQPFARAFGVEYEFRSDYSPEWYRNNLPYTWDAHYDNDNLIEAVSPITNFGANCHEHQQATAVMSRHGRAASPSVGGMHVHIDLRDLKSPTHMAKLQLTIATFEPVLFMLVHPHRLDCGWCYPIGPQLLGKRPRNQKLVHTKSELFVTGASKSSVSLYPQAFFVAHGERQIPVYTRSTRRRTVEFRMHESCVHWDKAKRWVQLLQILVQEGKSRRGIREQRLWCLFQLPLDKRIEALRQLAYKYDKEVAKLVDSAHDRFSNADFMAELYQYMQEYDQIPRSFTYA